MNAPSIYKFTDHAEFLRVGCATAVSRRERPWTLSDWADRLGYQSPRSLAMVLNGQRLPSAEMTEKLASELLSDPQERAYFRLLIELARRRLKRRATTDVVAALRQLNPDIGQMVPLDAATFAYIAEWFHLVVKQLSTTPTFCDDVEWLRRRLRGKATAAEIVSSLDVLERLGFLERDGAGRLVASPNSRGIRTTVDVPSEAIRLHHRQMLERAVAALGEQDVAEREFTGATFRMSPDRMAEAKERIRRFRDDFHREFEDPTATEIFQLGVHCFAHTQPDPPSKPGESAP